MGRYGRSDWQRRRDRDRQMENGYLECPKPGHGGYNPNVRTLGGRWVRAGCPKCAADLYEAVRRGV